MTLTNQIISLLNQSEQPLSILEEVIVQLTEGKFLKLKEIERLVFKHSSEALFKKRIVELKTKYPNGKQSEGLAELEFFQYTSPHYKKDEEEIEEKRKWAAEVDCLDYYNSLIE
jgi:hypothetical protein